MVTGSCSDWAWKPVLVKTPVPIMLATTIDTAAIRPRRATPPRAPTGSLTSQLAAGNAWGLP
jgi:hypothetical protein